MNAIAVALAARYPEDKDAGVQIVPLHEQIVAGARRVLYTLFAAVALLLSIACANVANLLLGARADASARRRFAPRSERDGAG